MKAIGGMAGTQLLVASFCPDDARLGTSWVKGGVVTDSGDAGCRLLYPGDHGSWVNDFIYNVGVSLSANRGNSTHLLERGDRKCLK